MRKALAIAALVFPGAAAASVSGDTDPASIVTATSATLHGTFSSQLLDTGERWFEYGAVGPCICLPGKPGIDWVQTTHATYGPVGGTVQLSVPVSGLTPLTDYDFRHCWDANPVEAGLTGDVCVDSVGSRGRPTYDGFTTLAGG